jgi:putative transcriptional regulator
MKQTLFQSLLDSIEEAGQHRQRGKLKKGSRATVRSKLREVRESAGLSQAQLAKLLNVSVRTLQNWEQARRRPSGPALALLKILELQPEIVLQALQSTGR